LNFNSAPASGTNNIVVLHLGVGAAATTTVADGAITTNKLAPGAVVPPLPNILMLSGM
jgi:hypothetical protein